MEQLRQLTNLRVVGRSTDSYGLLTTAASRRVQHRAEYLAFFDLLDLAPEPRILDCGAGPSSFTAEMAALGFDAAAAEPLYQQALAIREKALGPAASHCAILRLMLRAGLSPLVAMSCRGRDRRGPAEPT